MKTKRTRVIGGDLTTKRVFTTGDAAKVMGVSQRVVLDAIAKGHLKAFVMPGGTFRRIPRAELLRLMRATGIPLDLIEPTTTEQTR